MRTLYIILAVVFLLTIGFFIKYKNGQGDISSDELYNLDKTNIAFLSTMNFDYNYLFKGDNYNLKLDDRWSGFPAQNIFIIKKK
ncbi:MAG: hypothetical protein ACOCQW_02210 [Halanaerobiaceae bacterium]